MEDYIVSTAQLAELSGISDRQIEKLVSGGVLEHCGSERAYRFDLATAVRQYAAFLMSGISLRDWAPDA